MISGCTFNDYIKLNKSPAIIYNNAQDKLQNSNFKEAVKLLETLNNDYPFSDCAKQAQLDLIHAYYELDKPLLALATADLFMRLNPTNPSIDYVLYMHGLIEQKLDNNVLQNFFGIARSDCDPKHAILAFKDFNLLIRFYPKSFYVTDARKRLVFLKERLAQHDLSIIKYYNKRKAYIAVINRSIKIFKKYSDTKSAHIALKYMAIAYDKLGLTEEYDATIKLIISDPV